MFRRLSDSLPPDPTAPADLEKLGYFINDSDQIRMITSPSQKYQFRISSSDRVNDVHKEAMNECIRRVVLERLEGVGLKIIRLPVGASANENHVPVLVSEDLASQKRVKVYLGEREQDLGVLAYRIIGEDGINIGSAIDFANAVLHGPVQNMENGRSGLVIANPGQLLWYRGGSKAVSRVTWHALPRKSCVLEPFAIHPIKNTVPQSRDFAEHVRCVFEQILDKQIGKETKLEIIACEYTGNAALEYLRDNWSEWSARINGICLFNPQYKFDDLIADDPQHQTFGDFMSRRCRAYILAAEPVETAMTGREKFGCNCYSSGEKNYQECAFISAWRSVLDWFDMISLVPTFEEKPQTIEGVPGIEDIPSLVKDRAENDDSNKD